MGKFSFEVSAMRRGTHSHHFPQFFLLSRACNKIAAALTININTRAVAASKEQQVTSNKSQRIQLLVSAQINARCRTV
jgi:hypothetical protein